MMRSAICVLICFTLLFAANGVWAGERHVGLSGSDNAAGSAAAPWRTIGKANATARAGDVVIVHAGLYTEGISPTSSGTADQPIIFRAAPGEKVVLNVSTGVRLGSSSRHIIVDGFEIHASHQMVKLAGSSFITIRNCAMYGGRGTYAAFLLDNASYCVIQNNYFDRQDSYNRNDGGDGLKLVSGSHHNLIEGNTGTRCKHIAFASSYGKATVYQSYNVWRNNLAYKNHTNYSLQDGVQRCVFENNKGYYMGLMWTGGNGNCLQFTGTNCIIRFNTLYDDTASSYTKRRWRWIVQSLTGSANGGSPSVQYNKIYNNTVYGETDQGWKKAGWRSENFKSGLYQRHNAFKNNIFAGTTGAPVDDIDTRSSLAGMSNRYERNLLYGAKGAAATVRYEYKGGTTVCRLPDAIRKKPGQWSSCNREGDPLFKNTSGQGPAKDFTLREGSPAIDAGVNLTTAAGAASGSTTMVVADAGYFMDGWGIPGVQGDSIRIDETEPVGIARVDYATNTITLSSARTWAAGAPVYYFRSDRFQGAKPDIGAHEYGSTPVGSTAPGMPVLLAPSNGSVQESDTVSFSWEPVPGATSYSIQVASDPDFTEIEAEAVGITATSYAATGLRDRMFHHWRVAAYSEKGTSAWSGWNQFTVLTGLKKGQDVTPSQPETYTLYQNYPNPFNPSTMIRYSLADAGHVSLKVFNIIGQEVATLVDEVQSSGVHEARFDAHTLPNGAYFCRIRAGAYENIKKMLLVK